jgi:hypothetical protein
MSKLAEQAERYDGQVQFQIHAVPVRQKKKILTATFTFFFKHIEMVSYMKDVAKVRTAQVL